MFLPKNDVLRHRILKRLMELHNAVGGHFIKAHDTSITTEALAKELKVSVHEIRAVGVPMVMADEIMYDISSDGEILFAWKNAALAYYEKKYIIDGREKVRKNIDYYFKWATPVALVLGIFNAVQALNKPPTDKSDIQDLQRRVFAIEHKKESPILPTIYRDSSAARK